MKKIASINGFEAVLDEELYNELFDEEEYAVACENGDFSQEAYLDSLTEMATTYVPCKFEGDINFFDCAQATEHAITVYWQDGGNFRPAYRIKFEGAILTDADSPVTEEHLPFVENALMLAGINPAC